MMIQIHFIQLILAADLNTYGPANAALAYHSVTTPSPAVRRSLARRPSAQSPVYASFMP
ncbi:MAG: hypothetical protein AAF152_02390 [Cyanobacteria bacterium P01_A01_bin.114]